MAKARIIGGSLAAVIALAAPGVMLYEGAVLTTYADPVGIPTICFGHTGADVVPGRVADLPECQALLQGDLAKALDGVGQCIRVPMHPHQAAALVSFTYNVGTANLCASTLARKANSGDWAGACKELDRWVYAKGIKLNGLVKRRAAERAMCEGRSSKASQSMSVGSG